MDLSNLDVAEIEEKEMVKIDGGSAILIAAGSSMIAVGVGSGLFSFHKPL